MYFRNGDPGQENSHVQMLLIAHCLQNAVFTAKRPNPPKQNQQIRSALVQRDTKGTEMTTKCTRYIEVLRGVISLPVFKIQAKLKWDFLQWAEIKEINYVSCKGISGWVDVKQATVHIQLWNTQHTEI